MRTKYLMALSLLGGIAIGGFPVQGLSAQTKLKAYSIGEIEPIAGATVSPAYIAAARKALADAGRRSMGTLKGRVLHAEGGPPPIGVALTDWDSADAAIAFFQSKAWKDLAPEGEKTAKTIRRYIVEVEKQPPVFVKNVGRRPQLAACFIERHCNHQARNSSSSCGESIARRSLRPLPCSTRISMRLECITTSPALRPAP